VPVGYHHWFQLSVSVENESSNVLSQASPYLNVYIASCIFPWRGKMFSYGVNWHSTTSATFLWNYHFICIQIIFILPLCTFHILRICDDYHHFPLTTRSHSNWPYEFGLRWLMPGPVLSRFDQFLLIGPRTEGGPALRLLTKANFTFYRSCLCIVSARGSVFSKLL